MENLWAPWRMEMIERPQGGRGCIFCDLPRARPGEGRTQAEVDRGNLVLGRTEHCFAILNKFPYNNGHLMVVPRRHGAELSALSAAEHVELSEMLRVAHALVVEAYRPHGANLGMNLGLPAGAGIADHLHWHVVPRWNGDTNFMPVVGDVKVMIEHLGGSWDRLRPLFDARFHAPSGKVLTW